MKKWRKFWRNDVFCHSYYTVECKKIYWSLLNGKHQNPELLKKLLTSSVWLMAEFDFAQKLWSAITYGDDWPGEAVRVKQKMMAKNS